MIATVYTLPTAAPLRRSAAFDRAVLSYLAGVNALRLAELACDMDAVLAAICASAVCLAELGHVLPIGGRTEAANESEAWRLVLMTEELQARAVRLFRHRVYRLRKNRLRWSGTFLAELRPANEGANL